MCGSLKISDRDKLIQRIKLDPYTVLSRNLFSPVAKYDLHLSSHRFIRVENRTWWEKQFAKIGKPSVELTLRAEEFLEHNSLTGGEQWFKVPVGYSLKVVAHPDKYTHHYVASILTVDSTTPTEDPEIESLRQKVVSVHYRMPVLVKVAA